MEFDKIQISNLPEEESSFVLQYCNNNSDGTLTPQDNIDAAIYDRLIEIQCNSTVNSFIKFNDIKDATTKAYINIISYYIYQHKIRHKRLGGDEKDDYFKAEYLFNLNEYLKSKGTRYFSVNKRNEEQDEIIDIVNNIFDKAYFIKQENTTLSDYECFVEAEREFCDEKEIDYIAYIEHENRIKNNLPGSAEEDYVIAQHKFKDKQLRHIAYSIYQQRLAAGLPGDEKSDYENAEKNYDEWRSTQRIAMLCWNKSKDKSFPQIYYWENACKVVLKLKDENYNFIGINPFSDQHIINTIKEIEETEE